MWVWNNGFPMDPKVVTLMVICITALLACGCITSPHEPAGQVTPEPLPATTPPALILHASPQRYSPVMSSTPGIGLVPVVNGTGNISFVWNATYGHFLSWNSPDFQVNTLGDSTVNHGEKLYWSFADQPASTATPVTITVTATDTVSGQNLGRSTVTLGWDDNFTVSVKK